MKCEEIKEQLVLRAYEELDEESRANVELHLRGCPGCREEAAQLTVMEQLFAEELLPQVSPNLLAASRLRLDEALDEAGPAGLWQRMRSALIGTWHHLYSAPALAALLVGAGFLGGNLLTRYQISTQPKVPPTVTFANDTEGVIGNVSGIVQTLDPDVVQVKYNRIVPMTFQGRIDEPQVRQLLTMAAQQSADHGVRETSVDLLAKECKAGRTCDHGDSGSTGVRDALLVSLRYDKSPAVRLRALEGLQRFVGEDQKVRDAVLESLMHDRSADVRTHAIGTLEPVEGDTSVRQVLHTVSTQDENPYIRNASMQVLGNIDGIQ